MNSFGTASNPIPHLLALRERATPGPWRHEFAAGDAGNNHSILFGDAAQHQWIARIIAGRGNGGAEERKANAEYIVALVNAFPDLVARLEAAEAALRSGLTYAAEVHNRGEDDDEACDALMRFDEHVAAWRALTQEPK